MRIKHIAQIFSILIISFAINFSLFFIVLFSFEVGKSIINDVLSEFVAFLFGLVGASAFFIITICQLVRYIREKNITIL